MPRGKPTKPESTAARDAATDDTEAPPPKKLNFDQASIFNSGALKSALPPCPLFAPPADKVAQDISIAELTCGVSDKQIHARVSMLHHYMEGKPLKVRLYDGTAEITLTVFGNQARKFETVMKINSVVSVKGFKVQTSNPNFISINGQDKELILNSSDGQIVISNLDMPAIPFCFQDLASIELMSSGQCTDFLGIIYKDLGLVQGLNKSGKEYFLRKLLATDKTKKSILLKVWGTFGKDFTFTNPISVIIRHAKLELYESAVSLAVGFDGFFWSNPDIACAIEIKEWLETQLS